DAKLACAYVWELDEAFPADAHFIVPHQTTAILADVRDIDLSVAISHQNDLIVERNLAGLIVGCHSEVVEVDEKELEEGFRELEKDLPRFQFHKVGGMVNQTDTDPLRHRANGLVQFSPKHLKSTPVRRDAETRGNNFK